MKIKPVLAFILVCTIACNSSADQTYTPDSSLQTKGELSSEVSEGEVQFVAEDAEKHAEILKKLNPISKETLQTFFPENVMAMHIKSVSADDASGYTSATAVYNKDSAEYQVTLYDCAGDAGATFYGMSYLTRINMQNEDEKGYEKTIDFMGTKAIETYKKQNNNYSLNFLTENRFWVSISANNSSSNNLKLFAKSLHLENLKNLK